MIFYKTNKIKVSPHPQIYKPHASTVRIREERVTIYAVGKLNVTDSGLDESMTSTLAFKSEPGGMQAHHMDSCGFHPQGRDKHSHIILR